MLLTPAFSDEHSFARFLGRILRGGVLLAGSIVLAGGIIYLAKRASVSTDYRIFQGEPVEFRSLDRIIVNAAMGSGRGLIQLGLVFLIATPIARVMFSIVGFWREGDHAYVLITLTVLALLGYSLLAA